MKKYLEEVNKEILVFEAFELKKYIEEDVWWVLKKY